MFNRIFNKVSGLEQQLSQYLLILVAVLFIALITEQFWSFYTTLSFQPRISATRPQFTNTVDQQYNTATITKSNLFGQSRPKTAVNKKIPTTNLQLILRGAFTSSIPEQGSALIESADGITHSYRVNSKINSNTTLHSVFSNRVILSHNGQLETLKFPAIKDRQNEVANSSTTKGIQRVPGDIKQAIQNNFSVNEIRQTAKQLNASSMTPEQRQQLIKSRLQELRNRSKKKG